MTSSREFQPGDYVQYYSKQQREIRRGYVDTVDRVDGDARVYVFFNGMSRPSTWTNASELTPSFDPAKNPHDLHPIQ